MSNMKPCPCCGQMRPYPTEPGEWEYREYSWLPWEKCKIVRSTGKEHHEVPEGELLFYREGGASPAWWPDHAEWRKIEAITSRITIDCNSEVK